MEKKSYSISSVKLLISTFFFALLLFAGVILASLVVLTGGYILNHVSSVGLLPASVLFLATAATILVSGALIFINDHLKKHWLLQLEDHDGYCPACGEYHGDEDGEEYEEEDETGSAQGSPLSFSVPKAGRNQLCPCGSGRKYKRCCLNRDIQNQPEDIPF